MASDAKQAKADGSVWIWEHQGQEWPVMLCSHSIPPSAFMATRRDGETPAILLGRRK